jgi:hypothetical protein
VWPQRISIGNKNKKPNVRDHRPIHVHVRKGDGEAIFNVEDTVDLRESAGMKVRDLARAQELAEENKEIIIKKWYEHLG